MCIIEPHLHNHYSTVITEIFIPVGYHSAAKRRGIRDGKIRAIKMSRCNDVVTRSGRNYDLRRDLKIDLLRL